MAQNYYDGTGVLVLDKVTPVIRGLFGLFRLDETYPGDGRVYIARSSEVCTPCWDEIADHVYNTAKSLGLKLADHEWSNWSLETYLKLLAPKSGKADIDAILPDDHADEADLADVFDIAKMFDDGHGLKAMKFQNAWHADSLRLNEFGGSGEYLGKHYFTRGDSSTTVATGETVDAALEKKDYPAAAKLIAERVHVLLEGILDAGAQDEIRALVAQSVAAGAVNAKVKALKWYSVTGRIPGDHEDTHYAFQAADRAEAISAFEEAIYANEPDAAASREDIRKEHGQCVFINSVVWSHTPITSD